MGIADFVVLALLGLLAALALRHTLRKRKDGCRGCSGGCAGCPHAVNGGAEEKQPCRRPGRN